MGTRLARAQQGEQPWRQRRRCGGEMRGGRGLEHDETEEVERGKEERCRPAEQPGAALCSAEKEAEVDPFALKRSHVHPAICKSPLNLTTRRIDGCTNSSCSLLK